MHDSLLQKFVQGLKSAIVRSYDCMDKPWVYEVTLEPTDMNTTPPDLKQCITINGIKNPNTLTVIRMAEKVAISTTV